MMVGRPRKFPVAASAAEDQPQTETSAAVAPSRRRRRASVGGLRMKLEAPKRPGFVRRWVLNDPSRVLQMQDLGYDFAEADAKSDGVGTRIERHAGKDADGKPQRLVLMETPDEEYAIGQKEKEQALAPFEAAIKAGRDTTGRLQDSYQPSDKSSLSHSSA